MGVGSQPTWPLGGPSSRPVSPRSGEEGEYQVLINDYFGNLLASFNSRDQDVINQHLDTIQDTLARDFEILKLLYGGSLGKRTYVDGLSDIDVLAIISSEEGKINTPQELIDYFTQRLQDRFPYTFIKKGNLAVTLVFADGYEIQILPALQTKSGIRIADPDTGLWSKVIRPKAFANKLSEINQTNGNGVIPVIKLFKAINASLPKDSKLTGYHIESIAIEAFKSYDGPKTRKDMLLHFTDFASKQILKPIEDKTGQSLIVDEYLGETNSIKRQMAGGVLSRLYRRMKNADDERSIESWKSLMGE